MQNFMMNLNCYHHLPFLKIMKIPANQNPAVRNGCPRELQQQHQTSEVVLLDVR